MKMDLLLVEVQTPDMSRLGTLGVATDKDHALRIIMQSVRPLHNFHIVETEDGWKRNTSNETEFFATKIKLNSLI